MTCDIVYLTYNKKLTGSQFSPPHGTNKKLKCETNVPEIGAENRYQKTGTGFWSV